MIPEFMIHGLAARHTQEAAPLPDEVPGEERRKCDRSTGPPPRQPEEAGSRSIKVRRTARFDWAGYLAVMNPCRHSADVANTASGLGRDDPAGFSQPPHQLDLLVVQEETFIEEADLLQRLDAKHDAAAGHPIDFQWLGRLDRDRWHPKQPIERAGPGTARKLAADRRKRECASGWRSVWIDQLATDCGYSTIGGEVLHQRFNGSKHHFSVGVQKLDVVGGLGSSQQGPNSLIVRPAEAAIDRHREKLDPIQIFGPTEGLRQPISRAVARTAIDNHHPKPRQRLTLLRKRNDAQFGELRRAVIDGDDRDIAVA